MARREEVAPATRITTDDEPIILGSALADAPSRRRICAMLKPDDFVREEHRRLFAAVLELDRRGLAYSEDTIAGLAGPRESWGDFPYLRQVVKDYGQPNPNLDFHVGRLRAQSLKSLLAREAIPELLKLCEDPRADLGALASLLQRWGARSAQAQGSRAADAPDVALATWQRVERGMAGADRVVGFSEPAIDGVLSCGLGPGKMSVVAGRPTAGKSLFCVALTRRRALDGQGTCYVHCEATKEEVGLQMAAAHLRIPLRKLARQAQTLTEDERLRVREFLRTIYVKELFEVVESPFTHRWDPSDKNQRRGYGHRNEKNLEILEGICARTAHKVVIVDLIGYALPEQEVELLDEALLICKDVAKRHAVHLLLVHHLKRGDRIGRTQRPTMEDLRATGGWEQYVDAIYLIDRPRKRKSGASAQSVPDTLEVIIAKQRGGAESHVIYDFVGACSDIENGRVANYAAGQEESEADSLAGI